MCVVYDSYLVCVFWIVFSLFTLTTSTRLSIALLSPINCLQLAAAPSTSSDAQMAPASPSTGVVMETSTVLTGATSAAVVRHTKEPTNFNETS